jgi:tripartite-type tricarboxylate transporter receptor subunit TctC
MNRRRWIALPCILTFLCVVTWTGGVFAAAEKFPSREIIIVVPFSAGGPQDLGARVLTEYLSKELGVSVLVENRPEAGAVKGVLDVYKAKPDGYLLLSTLFPRYAQTEIVYKAPYKILEMSYLAAFNNSDTVLAVSNESPYKSLKELAQASKKKSLNFGMAGMGSLSHLTAAVIQKNVGINCELIPFKGDAAATMALLGGNVDVITIADLTASVHKEKIRALGISSEKRTLGFPDAPTFKEMGFNVPVLSAIQGISGPPALPEAIGKVLSNALAKAINNPELKKKITGLGANPIYMTGPEFKNAALSSYRLVEEYKEIFVESK